VEPHEAQLVVFDNDGTLYPSGPEVGRAVLAAHRIYTHLHNIDVPTPDTAWLEHMIGADAKEFYAAMLPGQPKEVQQAFEDFCLDYEHEAVARYPHMYEGAEELLTALKWAGRKLALVTNGGPTYVQYIWEACDYGRFFTSSYPFAPPGFLSKSERLKQAIADAGSPATVMVGDRLSDLEAASDAGALFVGCSYGYANPGELDGARYVVNGMGELYNLLLAPEEKNQ
jgi:phosphoglycolate phosphatase